MIQRITNKHNIKHRITLPYHPQANGQVESSNKVIEGILTKIVRSHHKDWAIILPKVLWAYRTTWWSTTNFSPYELVYGKTATFLVEFQIRTLRTALELNMDLDEAQKQRLNQLNKLDEKRLAALHHNAIVQQQRTKWHDRFIKKKVFQKDD